MLLKKNDQKHCIHILNLFNLPEFLFLNKEIEEQKEIKFMAQFTHVQRKLSFKIKSLLDDNFLNPQPTNSAQPQVIDFILWQDHSTKVNKNIIASTVMIKNSNLLKPICRRMATAPLCFMLANAPDTMKRTDLINSFSGSFSY